MSGSYRLTFNKPAVSQLLVTQHGEAADGIRIRIENGTAQFLPIVGSSDDDVVLFEQRSRGGIEVILDGERVDELVEALQNDKGPFHTLRRVAGGWIEPVGHAQSTAPSKFVPHVRLWLKGKVAEPTKRVRSRRVATSQAPELDILSMLDKLRQAKTVLEDYRRTPRRGQPPRAVKEAKVAMSQFESVVVDFMPEISQAHNLLDRLIGHKLAA